MLVSFARMIAELLRHSDRKDVFERLPQHLKDAHRPRAVERDDAPLVAVPMAPIAKLRRSVACTSSLTLSTSGTQLSLQKFGAYIERLLRKL